MYTFIRTAVVLSAACFLSTLLFSCVILYIPYIRNSSNEARVVRFSVQNGGDAKPGHFRLAHSAVEFRKKFNDAFTDSLAPVQINSTTWEITLPPYSTVTVPSNFYTYGGMKAHSTVVSIVKGNTADTVYDYARTNPVDRFHYKSHGARISPKICYYDIRE